MYQIRGSGTTPINTPKTPWGTEQPWGVLIVFTWSNSSAVTLQCYCRPTPGDCRTYIRGLSGTPAVWGPWRCITSDYGFLNASISLETVFMGKSLNDMTGYYGSIVLPYKVYSEHFSITLNNTFGTWTSDGKSHSLDLANARLSIGTFQNIIWVTIPATNISTNNIIWARLSLTFTRI